MRTPNDDDGPPLGDLHPTFPGEATVGEMIRQFWRFGQGRPLLITVQIILSLAGFALTALIPLRIGDLLGTALVSANARGEVERFVNDPNSVERAVQDEVLPQFGTTAERNAAVAAIRATQFEVRVSAADELLDTLFPNGLRYSPRGLSRIEDPEADWEVLVSGILRGERIGRSDLEDLVSPGTDIGGGEAISRNDRNRAFSYLVNLLLVDDSASAQRSDFQRSRFVGQLIWFAVIVLAVFVLRAVTLLLAARTTYSMARRLQDAVFARVHDTALLDGGALPRPSMVSRCTSYVENVTKALVEAQTRGIPDVAALLFSTALLLYIDVPVGLMMVAVIVIFEIARRVVAPRWSRLARERLDLNTAMGEAADSAITQSGSVRATRSEVSVRRGFARWADAAAAKARRLAGVGEGVELSAFGIGQFSVLAAIALVGFVRQDLSLGEATAVILYVREVSTALEGVPSMVVELQEAAPYMRRLRRVLSAPLRRPEPPQPRPLPSTPSSLVLDDATYVHPDGSTGCRAISISASTSTWTIVCGLAGSGSSEILDLCAGLEVPSGGRVLVDDVALTDVNTNQLRFGIAVMPAQPELIEGTVRENIEWSRSPDTTTGRGANAGLSTARAVEAAGLIPWLATLADGLDTQVGQRRERIDAETCIRIHLARVLASDAAIVVTHDVCRLLDREVGEQLWAVMRRELQGRIVVATTERLDLIGDDDTIHCLRLGEVVESGSRQQLLQRNAYFAHLWGRLVEGGSPSAELASIPSLASLSEAALDDIVTRLVTERYEAGAPIFRPGEPADRVFIVVDGTVDLFDGERRLASVRAGFHFGDFDPSGPSVRTSAARARTPVVLRSLHRLAISAGIVSVLDRPREERALAAWLLRNGPATRARLDALNTGSGGDTVDIDGALRNLLGDGLVSQAEGPDGVLVFRMSGAQRRRALRSDLLDALGDD